MPRFLALLATVLLLCAASAFSAGVDIEKAIGIATSNSVRVDLSLKSDQDFGPVLVNGRISRNGTDALLWQGPLGDLSLKAGLPSLLSRHIRNLDPDLWDVTSPVLYTLTITATKDAGMLAQRNVRFGFRSFEIDNGQFHLNGRPLFLRGIAINPPGRTIPDAVGESRAFAEAYVRYLKSQNVNIFRITTDESQVWFDVCDELGMMLYAGRYGAPPGATAGKKVAPADHKKIISGYRELFEHYASHLAIVMYLLANELPVSGERGAAFSALLNRAHEELRRWDPTRPYIGNAGYGEGREGDVCDVHRYWGWYYNSFLTYYNLRDKLYPKPLFGDLEKNQPLTFTECVGSFTGSSGEINLVRSKQLAPRLGWLGHTEQPVEDALRYQCFMVRQATESFRRMRPLNPRLAGLMPFTILFYNWSGITSFDQMKAKPAMEQMRISYQPVLLSWELWAPQVYAGTRLHPIAHVINDDDHGQPLTGATLVYRLQQSDGTEACRRELKLPSIPYFGTWSQALELELPANLPTDEYVLSGQVLTGGQNRSTNFCEVFIAGTGWKNSSPSLDQPIWLYDTPGKTAAALTNLRVAFKPLRDLTELPPNATALVIGERAWDSALARHKTALRDLIRRGGHILCLQQDATDFARDWLPAKITFLTGSPNDTDYPPRTRPFREQMNINPERPNHPIVSGLHRDRLRLWSDYTGWDQTKLGFPKLYPVTGGFKLDEPEALAHTAIFADYDRGLEGVALCEMFDGEGSVILSGFDVVNRVGLDPAADRLLLNLVRYIATKNGHYAHPLIERPIRWGDFSSECGTICGSLNGLLVNAEWLTPPTNPSATPLPPNTGAWNMAPGDQFVPRGRNPLGAYGYSTASSLRDSHPNDDIGSGFFWARIPAGKQFVLTNVKNPAGTAAQFKVSINNDSPQETTIVPSGQTTVVQTPLPMGTTNVYVRYSGAKTLILLETVFR